MRLAKNLKKLTIRLCFCLFAMTIGGFGIEWSEETGSRAENGGFGRRDQPFAGDHLFTGAKSTICGRIAMHSP
jgi:hypothetical protein